MKRSIWLMVLHYILQMLWTDNIVHPDTLLNVTFFLSRSERKNEKSFKWLMLTACVSIRYTSFCKAFTKWIRLQFITLYDNSKVGSNQPSIKYARCWFLCFTSSISFVSISIFNTKQIAFFFFVANMWELHWLRERESDVGRMDEYLLPPCVLPNTNTAVINYKI